MGLILDSSILIAAERRHQTAAEFLRAVTSASGDQTAALSAVGLVELANAFNARLRRNRAFAVRVSRF